MKVLFKLFLLYFESGLGITDTLQKLKAKPRGSLRIAGFVVLFIYIFAAFGFTFVFSSMKLYDALAPAGFEALVLGFSSLVALGFCLFVGFMSCLSQYYLPTDLQIMALPVRPWQILTSRFMINYLSILLFSFISFGSSAVVYGIKSAAPFGFYLVALLQVLYLPLLPLVLNWIISFLLIKALPFIRQKERLVTIGTILVFIPLVAFQISIQGFMQQLQDAEVLQKIFISGGLLDLFQVLPPLFIAIQAMLMPGNGLNLVVFLGLILGTLLLIALVIALSARPWMASLPAFAENRLKRNGSKLLKEDRAFKVETKSKSLLLREIRLMNREPVYLINGPMVSIIMPIIIFIGTSFGLKDAQSQASFADIGNFLRDLDISIFVLAGLGCFMSLLNGIAISAVSRDAKMLDLLHALPLSAKDWLKAKLQHGTLFTLLGLFIGIAVSGFMLRLPWYEGLAAFAFCIPLAYAFESFSLRYDFRHPKLDWETPVAAMKQNINAVLAVGVLFGLLALEGILVYAGLQIKLSQSLIYGILLIFNCALALIFGKRLYTNCEGHYSLLRA